ncbi:MAG: tungstate ABC transporter substrate-binding protein WtpA [Dehalococcoidia bacterium]|jgi:molybdate/tungstate transport system substrate-binding protein|nr:tungstate ABC transporter substrate-binding protein WtpA [Dehalococcoidia bacterium]
MKRLTLGLLPTLVLLLVIAGCGGGETLTIFHAGSLAVPFDEAGEAFTEQHSDVTVQTEGAGSRTTIRKVTELGKNADIIGSADYLAIEELMFPEYADWYIIFATNEMVIAYTEDSKYEDEITADNWYQILLRDGVEYGHSNPNADPCGYRTLMLWQLAEAYYGEPGLYQKLDEGCPKKNIRSKSVELIALLQAGALDYAYEYRSVAMQHGLKYLSLPDEIDLSDFALADYYAQAEVEVTGKEPGTTTTLIGAPIAYGVTIPKDAPHPELAISFLQFLLGPEGQAIMADCGQPPIAPAIASDQDRLPVELKEFVQP